MSVVSLTGDDTIIINNRILNDFAEGDVGEITYPNEVANVKTGKNGNSIYAFNASGIQAELKLRVIRGSADDKFFNGLLANQNASFASTVLLEGTFVKNIGDGQGNITKDTYIMGGGIFTKMPETKSNVEGDTEQSVTIYSFKFSNVPRTLT